MKTLQYYKPPARDVTPISAILVGKLTTVMMAVQL